MLSVVSAGAAAGMGGMDRLRGGGRAAARELAATRERQVRLHAVRTDLGLNLPPSIALPDGEDYHHHHRGGGYRSTTTTTRLQIRDAEQESEIYQKCIRPPPNRTVTEEDGGPYRSSSAGVLASSSSSSTASCSSNDWSTSSAPLMVRCHSMSSSKPGSSSSSSHHYSSAPGQKTDFLQRTVKILTGKKTPQVHSVNSGGTGSMAAAAATPCVIVPGRRRDPATGGGRPPV